MNYGTLAKLFHEHAQEIISNSNSNSKPNTAIYRSRSYDRVSAKILDTYKPNMLVTEENIHKLNLTDYMTGIITDILHSKKPVRHLKLTNTSAKKLTNTSAKKLTNSSAKKLTLLKQLTEFMGIGKVKAKQLIDEGLVNINQLHMKKWMNKLPEETQLYIKLKPNKKIKHADIQSIANELKCNFNITIVGSYRRKKPTSRDVDVMLVSNDELAINKYLKKLKKNFTIYPYSQGKDKLSVILIKKEKVFKLDVFRVNNDNKIPMLLYSTGSKEFNIKMRRKAKRLGYLLNQKGLFKNSKKIKLKTEKDYFDILQMKYVQPSKRN